MNIEADLRAPLTQSRLVSMMRDLTVPASSSGDPESLMSRARADVAASCVALCARVFPPASGSEPTP